MVEAIDTGGCEKFTSFGKKADPTNEQGGGPDRTGGMVNGGMPISHRGFKSLSRQGPGQPWQAFHWVTDPRSALHNDSSDQRQIDTPRWNEVPGEYRGHARFSGG